MAKPKIAFIGTGGTIASLGRGPLDLQDYGAIGRVMQADAIVEKWPVVHQVADVIPVNYRNIPSTAIGFADWKALLTLCHDLPLKHPDLDGIVIGHGTATLEETAYFLNLTLKIGIPVVVVGAQRPSSALSTDAGMNLVNAIRVAGSPEARGMGVLVLLNDEIHAAREVTKTSTLRLQTFRTPDFGVLGHADGVAVVFFCQPLRRRAPYTEFDVTSLETIPRVDISYSYAGADGTAVRAFAAAGARGIVSAGFPPGFSAPGEAEALREAVTKGIVVVQSTRAGSGRTFRSDRLKAGGLMIADNLNPQKARILLSLALTRTRDPDEIRTDLPDLLSMDFDPDQVREFERTGWNRAAATYESAFATATRPFVAPLLDAASIAAGDAVLDLCCGPGFVGASAAERGARVGGLDFSPAMLTEARARFPGIAFTYGDAESPPFPDAAFDAVVSNFGVHHVPRPALALAGVHRILKPRGRFAFSIWAGHDENIAWKLVFEAVRRFGDPNASAAPSPGGGFATGEDCLIALHEAGFIDTRVRLVHDVWRHRDAASLLGSLRAGTARMAAMLAAQSVAAMPAILSGLEDP